jgi:hypothetical protein
MAVYVLSCEFHIRRAVSFSLKVNCLVRVYCYVVTGLVEFIIRSFGVILGKGELLSKYALCQLRRRKGLIFARR